MIPVSFEGAREIHKPEGMTDEQCFSVWAKIGFSVLTGFYHRPIPPAVYADVDNNGYRYFLTAWKPSYEDLQALNRGEPFYIKTLAKQLPPMAVFTLDENNNCNDAG